MKNQEKSSYRILPLWITILLVVVMAASTIIEKIKGSEFVYNHIYGAWWFVYVWALMVALSIIGIVKGQVYRNKPVLFIHLSFIIILIGALCTKTMSEQGSMVVTKNIYSSVLQTNEKSSMLPFSIKLDSFYISYYPGTNAPADYTSQIIIMDKPGESHEAQVSMNNTYKYKGYKFYQSSFEDDWQTSILSVNRDVVGVPITYIGYFLFMLSMIWFLLSPKNIYRQLFKHPLLKKGAFILLLLISIPAYSQTATKDGLSVEKAQAETFCDLWILNEGRIMPVSTFAQDFTQKIIGKKEFNDFNANQFFMGILFFYDNWINIPIFEINDKSLRAELNVKGNTASLSDFYNNEGNYKLSKYWNDISEKGEKSAHIKEIEKLNDKVHLIEVLRNGKLLQMYPKIIDNHVQWLYPTQDAKLDEDDLKFISTSLLNYRSQLMEGNEKGAFEELNKIKKFQNENAKDVLPSDAHKKVEKFYAKSALTSWLFKINLTVGILSLLALLILSGKKLETSNKVFYFILIGSFVIHTLSIGMRTYIAGRLPFSNGYETMLLIAWCGMFMPILFGRKIPLLIPFGLLLSGCTLLVAHISAMNPKITPLVPVLSSPLLSVHVSVIMFSYTLFGFIALNSITSFIQLIISKKGKEETLKLLERNKIYSLICLYPAIFLLGAGIFIGAIWANISWGRYWGWDPKEVWALITFMIYSLVLHKKMKLISNPFAFHTFGLFAFLSVLMTYFGVNYILGGIHSYAGDMQLGSIIFIVPIILILILFFVIVSYIKYKKIFK